jgi:UDP-N-acetylglucosamine 2-epimerase (non-hydrolysing)
MKEILDFHADNITASNVLRRLGLAPGKFFTVSLHREENVDDPVRLAQLVETLNAVARHYRMPLVFSTHPRTRKRLAKARLKLDPRIRSLPPLGFFDYVALQKSALCTISDSGTISEESSLLGFAAVTVREAHERPEAVDEGTVIMSSLGEKYLIQAIELAVRQIKEFGPSRVADDYQNAQVSWKVAKIIYSYTGFVNRVVWRKQNS